MYQPYYPGSQYLNPYQNNFNQQPNQLIRVNGIEGAKAYQMLPNSTVALFDANEDIMYIKSSDGAGFPTIRTFSFSEALPEERTSSGDFISRQEFEDFKTEVLNYGQQLIQQQNGQAGQQKQSSGSNKPNDKR